MNPVPSSFLQNSHDHLITGAAEPARSPIKKKVNEFAQGVWSNISFLTLSAVRKMDRITPVPIKKLVASTYYFVGNALEISWLAILCLNELLDHPNSGGTKDPLASINMSRKRLKALSNRGFAKDFAISCDFLGDQASKTYLKNKSNVKEQASIQLQTSSMGPLIQSIEHSLGELCTHDEARLVGNDFSLVNYLLDNHQNLIAKTIEANVLHLFANLCEQANDFHFEDPSGTNPFGRLVAVCGSRMIVFEDCLNEIDQLEGLQKHKKLQYENVFKEMSQSLLALFYPKGAEDLLIFHHTIPVTLMKGYLWKQLVRVLPRLLEKFYLDTKCGGNQSRDSVMNFCGSSQVFSPEEWRKIPSRLFQSFVRKDQALLLDAHVIPLEKRLQQEGYLHAKYLSQKLIKHVRQFLVTNDPTIHKIGKFAGEYFMERIRRHLQSFQAKHKTKPLLLTLSERWVRGTPLQMIQTSLLSHRPKHIQMAVKHLLSPFGLYPNAISNNPSNSYAWSYIVVFLQENLSEFLSQQLKEWDITSRHKKRLVHLQKMSIFSHLFSLLHSRLEVEMQKWVNDSIAKYLHAQFCLSDQEQVYVDEQWQHLLSDKKTAACIKLFIQNVIEAFVYRVSDDVYTHYRRERKHKKKKELPLSSGPAESFACSTFGEWLVHRLTKSCEMSLGKMTDNKKEMMREAIHFKRNLCNVHDPVLFHENKKQFEKLWLHVQPFFADLVQRFLSIPDYHVKETLPVPPFLQASAYKMIGEVFPECIFESVGELLLPMLEKPRWLVELHSLPHGYVLVEGCQALANDLVTHLPRWAEQNKEFITHWINHSSWMALTCKERNAMTSLLFDFLSKDKPFYHSTWQFMENYLEGVFLQIVLSSSKKSREDFTYVGKFILEAREKLLQVEDSIPLTLSDRVLKISEAKDKIFVALSHQLCDFLQITEQVFVGLPSVVQTFLFVEGKKKLAEALITLHQLDNKIGRMLVPEYGKKIELPVEEIAQAVVACSRFLFDKFSNEYIPLLRQIDLNKTAQEALAWVHPNYRIVQVVKETLQNHSIMGFQEQIAKCLSENGEDSYLFRLSQRLSPIIVERILHAFDGVLEKEQEEKRIFDRQIFMTLLPLFTVHLKHLNRANEEIGGVNLENYRKVANKIHTTIPTYMDEESRYAVRKEFWLEQVNSLLFLIFPKGPQEIGDVIAEIGLKPEQINVAWNIARELIADQMHGVLEMLFKKENLRDFCSLFFEYVIELAEEPIEISDLDDAEEEKSDDPLDNIIGEFVFEISTFTDLPMDRISQALRAALLRQCDGALLFRIFRNSIAKLAKIQNAASSQDTPEVIDKKLVKSIFSYLFRRLRVEIEHATDIFPHPGVNRIREWIIACCFLIIEKTYLVILRGLRIDDGVVDAIVYMITKKMEKIFNIFSQTRLHENFLFTIAKSFEDVCK